MQEHAEKSWLFPLTNGGRTTMHQGVLLTLVAGFSLLTTAAVSAQQGADLDSDGIVDGVDLDQDNDGIPDSLEGVQLFERLIDTPAVFFTSVADDDVVRPGLSTVYPLVSYADGSAAQLYGQVIASDIGIEWTVHEAMPKFRNLTAGQSSVLWRVSSTENGNAFDNIDLTISDLDGSRTETVVVSASDIAGYSLSLNTNVVVSSNTGQLRFTGTGSGGDGIDDSVTLHFRESSEMLVSYINGNGVQYADNLNNEANIAGYRHSLEPGRDTFYTPVLQFRDTDGDGVADHRDLDSDNDGLGDVIESGGLDANLDNLIDGPVDSNGIAFAASQHHDATTLQAVYAVNGQPMTGDDIDGDGLLSSVDGEPAVFGGSRAGSDSDNDGLDDLDEILIHDTSPDNPDTDDDGLGDEAEVLHYTSDPLLPDTDSDGLSDGDEVRIHGTMPDNADTDADGLTDLAEVQNGTDPLQPAVDNLTLVPVPADPQVPGVTDPVMGAASDTEAGTGAGNSTTVATTENLENGGLQLDDPAQAQSAPLPASLRTGLSGSAGCSLVSVAGSPDPLLPLMLLMSLITLANRLTRSNKA